MTNRTFASLLLSLALFSAPAAAASSPGVDDSQATFVPGQVLVKFKAGMGANARGTTLARRGHALIQDLEVPNFTVVRVSAGQSVEAAVMAYREDPSVEYAQPNYIYSGQAVPKDSAYRQLWGLKNTAQTITNALNQPLGTPLTYDVDYPGSNPGLAGGDIKAEAAWNAITDCSSVVVAVVDSGVNYNHEDLAANMWTSAAFPKHGYNFVDYTDDPMDLHGHGTHVAGTIGAVGNNDIGVTGVCWKASIMAVKVLGADNEGNTASFISGINFAVAQGAKVINMSIIGYHAFDQAYSEAVTRAQDADVVVVVCAGNSTKDNDAPLTNAYPCNFTQPNLICVAALDQKYALAGFSNYGVTKVMIGAPGTNVVSTWIGTSENVTYPISDPPSPDWTTSTSTSGGWGYRAVSTSRGPVQCLTDPPNYPTGTYGAGTDDRAWRALPVGKADRAQLKLVLAGSIPASDFLRIAYRAGTSAGDPFVDGTPITEYQKLDSPDEALRSPQTWAWDVSGCISSPACTIGFQLQAFPGSTAKGVAIGKVRVEIFTANTTSYQTYEGTSMASPHVAGVVTMLRAFNPRYNYADVVEAVKAGGRTVPALVGKTITGKALDAIGTISYLQPITGVTATVQ
jgi:subtilisin family serine protease